MGKGENWSIKTGDGLNEVPRDELDKACNASSS
jgi:hypothetical protein